VPQSIHRDRNEYFFLQNVWNTNKFYFSEISNYHLSSELPTCLL
jgi:hypothetical protein